MMEQISEVDFIKDAWSWPSFPVLPVIERSPNRTAGFLWAGGGPVVYLGNIFSLPGGNFEENTKGLEKRTYDSFEQLNQDWRVD